MSVTTRHFHRLRAGIAAATLLILVLTMGSCKEKTESLSPSVTMTNTRLQQTYFEIPAGLQSKGLGTNVEPGFVLVGTSFYDEGSFFKLLYYSYFYRGLVRFDLSNFKHKIVKATLQFKMKASTYQWKGVATNEKRTCASGLYIATEDWFSGPYNKVVPGDLYVPLPNLLPEKSSFVSEDDKVKVKDNQSFSIDVTPIVQDWLDNKRPNFGFMLVGPYEIHEESTDQWTSLYGPFALSLTYQEISF